MNLGLEPCILIPMLFWDILKSPGMLTGFLILILLFVFLYRARKIQYSAREVFITMACGLVLFFISLHITFSFWRGTGFGKDVGWPIQLYIQPTGSIDGELTNQVPLLLDDFQVRIAATLIFYLSLAGAVSTFIIRRSKSLHEEA